MLTWLTNWVAVLLVASQLSRNVIGFEEPVIGAFRSATWSPLNSRLFLIKLSVVWLFCRQFWQLVDHSTRKSDIQPANLSIYYIHVKITWDPCSLSDSKQRDFFHESYFYALNHICFISNNVCY